MRLIGQSVTLTLTRQGPVYITSASMQLLEMKDKAHVRDIDKQ